MHSNLGLSKANVIQPYIAIRRLLVALSPLLLVMPSAACSPLSPDWGVRGAQIPTPVSIPTLVVSRRVEPVETTVEPVEGWPPSPTPTATPVPTATADQPVLSPLGGSSLLTPGNYLAPAATISPTTSPTAAPSRTPLQQVEGTASATAISSVVEGAQKAYVVRVVDGDTIEVEIEGWRYKVRYIGMDTPETKHPTKPVECFGHEATEKNRELVEGKTVYLEKDVSETDRYGRLLRYVHLEDGTLVNAELVRLGYAQVSTYPPDVKYVDLFLRLQREARQADRGLWSKCK